MPVANKVRHRAASPGGASKGWPGQPARATSEAAASGGIGPSTCQRTNSPVAPWTSATARSSPSRSAGGRAGRRPQSVRMRTARGRISAVGLRFARSATASPWAGPPNSAMHASAGSCVSRSASAPTASGRARGSRRSRSESRPARRTPGSGSRTSSRSGPPAAFRPSVPAADAAARRTPGSRSASSSCTRSLASETPRAAATSTAAARTSGSGEPSARRSRGVAPGRDGLPRWRIAAASTGPSSSASTSCEQLPRLRALVAVGPERQGRETIGRRVRAVGDDLRQEVGPLARRRGRAATRRSRPLPPTRAGRPGGAAGSRAASGPSPGSSAGARPAGRRRPASSSARSSASAIASVRPQATVFAGRGAGRYPQ